jgi:hypothetical protein
MTCRFVLKATTKVFWSSSGGKKVVRNPDSE